MAEMERGLISERTQMGMNYLKKTYKRFTHSVYGLDANKQGYLEPNWVEQSTIDYMKWMLNLGVTASSIAKSLNTQGIHGKKSVNEVGVGCCGQLEVSSTSSGTSILFLKVWGNESAMTLSMVSKILNQFYRDTFIVNC